MHGQKIELINLSVKYGNFTAVQSTNLEVKAGEFFSILGPSGCGKTTLLRTISGFIKPSKGDVFVDGISIHADEIGVKSKIGYLPENNPLYEDLYVRESIRFIAQMHRVKDVKSAVENVIEKVGLVKEANKKIGQLSKGYQQRVGIAHSIVHNPKVLILDEECLIGVKLTFRKQI
mgnify:CR=1 FL=1